MGTRTDSQDRDNGKAPAAICRECGRTFAEKAKGAGLYNLTAEGPVCRNQSECRGRVLHAEFERRGLKQWSRHTQEDLLHIMDCPPPGWDSSKKWESVNETHERVEAAIEFFSTCWPVCLLYAVQTDADGEPIKEYGEWKHHTTRSLAAVLGLSQMSVVRAIFYLRQRHRITDSEGRYGIDLAPKPLSISERESCTRCFSPGPDAPEGFFSALLPSARKLLVNTLNALAAEPESCTRLRKIAAQACTQQNRAISEARTRAAQTVREACHGHVSLLSRPLEGESAPTPPSSSPFVDAPPSQKRADDGDGTPSLNELYTAGLAEGALAKLPPKEERPAALIAAKMAAADPLVDEDAAERMIRSCKEANPECTTQEIAAAIGARVEQAKERKSPVGFLLTAVPKLFAGDGLARIRKQVAAQARARAEDIVRHASRYTAEELQEAYKILGEHAGGAGSI